MIYYTYKASDGFKYAITPMLFGEYGVERLADGDWCPCMSCASMEDAIEYLVLVENYNQRLSAHKSTKDELRQSIKNKLEIHK